MPQTESSLSAEMHPNRTRPTAERHGDDLRSERELGSVQLTRAGGADAPCNQGTIYIDCTSTFGFDPNTGIQRVVRNLVNGATSLSQDGNCNVRCQPVVFRYRTGFVPVDGLPVPAVGKAPETWKTRSRRVVLSAIKSGLNATGLLNATRILRDRAYEAGYHALQPVRDRSKNRVVFRPGDVLLLADQCWGSFYPWNDVRRAQAAGAKVGMLVYDLIPLKHPEFVGQSIQKTFQKWCQLVASMADFAVCISQDVWNDVREMAADLPEGYRALRGGFFRLGADLDGPAVEAETEPTIKAAFGDCRNSYLMVGMISPRKNHVLALDAFDRLWQQGADVNLVIAGRYGWDADVLLRRLENHPQRNKRLFWFQHVRDSDLEFAYRHAAGLITTSRAEGFNLPIVESLSRGCPVLASDLAVHREVGGDHAAYFPDGDVESLARLVIYHQNTGTLPEVEAIHTFRWPDWNESCRELLRVVQRSTSERSAPATLKSESKSIRGQRRTA